MIHIKETFPDDDTVVIKVDGRLDRETLEPLERVYGRHVNGRQRIIFSLGGLMSVSKEGRNFLGRVRGQVSLMGLSEFLKMEVVNSAGPAPVEKVKIDR